MDKIFLNKSGKFSLIFVLLLSFFSLNASVGPGIPVRPFLDNDQKKNSYAMAKAMAMAMAMATSDRVLSGEDASSPINIDVAGTYGLSKNLTGTLIVISADDVTLDLGGHTIISEQSDSDMIIVEPGINRIKIKNGIIVNSVTTGTGNGILVQNGVSQVTIENIRAQGFSAGVKLDGEYGSEITKCQISECEFIEVFPSSGTSHGEHDDISIYVDTTGLDPGHYSCNINISSNSGNGVFVINFTISANISVKRS